jgi:hypothetical protein
LDLTSAAILVPPYPCNKDNEDKLVLLNEFVRVNEVGVIMVCVRAELEPVAVPTFA